MHDDNIWYDICMYEWSWYIDKYDKCVIEGSHNCFIDIWYVACLCMIPSHWAVIRSYVTEPWAHTPIDVICWVTGFIAWPKAQARRLIRFRPSSSTRRTKFMAYDNACIICECIRLYIYPLLWPKVSIWINVSYVWCLSLIKVKLIAWMLRKQKIMIAWIKLFVVELEARVCVYMVGTVDNSGCMNMVIWGRARGSRTCFITWVEQVNWWQIYRINKVCIFRGYAVEISLVCTINVWMYVYVFYCMYVWVYSRLEIVSA